MDKIFAPLDFNTKLSQSELYDNSAFYSVKEEVRKLTGIEEENQIDWVKVEDLSYEVLTKYDKNLQVLTYWFVARLYNIGYQSILDSYFTLKGFIFKVNINPSHRTSRYFDWWIDKTVDWINNNIKNIERDDVKHYIDEIKNIEKNLPNGFSELIPTYKILNVLESRVLKQDSSVDGSVTELESIDSDRDTQGSCCQVKEVTDKNSDENHQSLGNPSENNKLLKSNLLELQRIAEKMFTDDISDTKSYRIRRIGIWADIYTLPIAVEGGKTNISPPDINDKKVITTLLESKNWLELLRASERKILQYPYWLDLNRYSYMSLLELGYSNIAEQIKNDVYQFSQLIPEVRVTEFVDGMPYADLKTIEWITKKEKKEKIKDPGRKIIKSKKEIFIEIYDEAQTSLEIGRIDLALCQIDLIIIAIDEYKIDEWEPELSIMFLELALEIYYKGKKKSHYLSVIQRISRIDPNRAMNLFRN
ncbi:TssA family type VI secretion system protein [Enterovibrio norvegicus]|uniref:TssA family type VI secretion system protein n=1 Tax=Enterovibrio norvegicus TaxID=188144 RepID=UPI00352EA819